jgi:hypothetical protein
MHPVTKINYCSHNTIDIFENPKVKKGKAIPVTSREDP